MRAPFLLVLLLSSTTALAQAPADIEPVDSDPADVEADRIEPDPADVEPVDTDPADVEPVDTEPADVEPLDTDPADVEPVDTDPAGVEPDAPHVSPPAVAVDLDEPAPPLRLELEGCRDLVRRHDLPAARVCYERRAPGDDERGVRVRQQIAAALVDVDAPTTTTTKGMGQLGELVTSGKAELIAASTLFGSYIATLALLDTGFTLFQLLQLSVPWGLQPVAFALLFLTPIAGGAAGLAASVGAHLAWPEMTAGDANLLRASIWLGTFNSVVAGVLTQGFGRRLVLGWWRFEATAQTTAMLAGAIGTLGAGAALALVTSLPEAAGPLGLSLGLWGGTLAVLGQLMFDLPLRFEEGTLLVGAVANAGFAAGLLAAPFLPLTRFETWLLDLGAVAGALLGTAVVLGVPAPNPVLGYGGIGAGLVLGAGAGVALGKLVPLGLELVELPRLVAMGPLLLPPGHTGEVPIGAQVSVSLDGALDLVRRR